MCIILFAFQVVPEYPLVLIANRDEFYDRPALPAGWWPDEPDIYAGRDVAAGGTWLGVTRGGRFAAVTNYRDPSAPQGPRSRGELVVNFLRSGSSPSEYMLSLHRSQDEYSPFNLIAGAITPQRTDLAYFSNRGDEITHLQPGIYGLSNHFLDTDWPKIQSGKKKLEELVSAQVVDDDPLFDLLADPALAADAELPDTGIPYEREKALSSIFISTPDYGTRCSSVLKVAADGEWTFNERTHV